MAMNDKCYIIIQEFCICFEAKLCRRCIIISICCMFGDIFLLWYSI